MSVTEVEFYVFSSIRPTNANMESKTFSRTIQKNITLFNKDACTIGKEALRAGIYVIEDVGNNKPLKESIKS